MTGEQLASPLGIRTSRVRQARTESATVCRSIDRARHLISIRLKRLRSGRIFLAHVSTVTAIPDAALLLGRIGSGRRHWVGKYELHRQLEQTCKSERKRERRVIFSSLNGIDRLARDLKSLRQLGL